MKFRTLYADPPWDFTDKLDSTRTLEYKTMTIEELMNLPVSSVMEDNAHIYLWSTSSHIHEALHLMEQWGFVYKTIIPWIKLTKTGKIHFGMGHYYRGAHEICLFGVRGKLNTMTNNTRNVLLARSYSREKHSSKPVEMYHLIESNSPDPHLELFSRNNRPGWVMLGDKIDGKDIRVSLSEIDNLMEVPQSGQQSILTFQTSKSKEDEP